MANLIDVLYDPYAKHSPFRILKHPPGRRLFWVSIEKVKHKGWGGWIPVQKGDGIYEKLDQYVSDSPLKYMKSVDTTVQRGQNMLAWMPLGMALARKKQSADRANALQGIVNAETRKIPREMGAFGDGLSVKSKKPDPTDIHNIMKGYGVTEEDLEHPDADPRNYAYTESAETPMASPLPATPAAETPIKRGPGRPRKPREAGE